MKAIIKGIITFCCMLTLFACGGGGGGSVQTGTAVVKLSTEGALPQGTSIAGIGVTVNLPPGVTVRTDSAGKVASDVVAGSGVTSAKATLAEPDYVAPTATAPGKVSFVLASTAPGGFGTGEFATITCDVASGATPKATDITTSDFKPVDLNGAAITGLTVTHTAEFK